MYRVVCLLFLAYGTLTAGAHNDYEVCAGKCEQRLEVATPNSLGDTICYDTALVCAIKAQAQAHIEPILAEVSHRLDFGGADPREDAVKRFFIRNNCPVVKYTKLFIQVADDNNIDWRLLPTFALIESGGGRVHRNNNIFGWDSGRKRFKSIEEGIRYVARALTLGPYKGKMSAQIIRVYNTHRKYWQAADKILNSIN